MRIAEQISVTVTSADSAHKGKTLLLDVEEFQPIEPSNYAWTAGWNCAVEIRGETVWFFVDETGVVWEGETEVGICPQQEREYDERTARYEDIHETCMCGDPGDCGEAH
jgi:hypothetical protein